MLGRFLFWSIVLDDAHACIDSIRDACTLKLSYKHGAYPELRDLFDPDLRAQGPGTLAEMKENNKWEPILPVPYWAWIDKADDVAAILARHSDTKEVKFAWQLLKDSLRNCHCVFSGTELEIHPHVPPLDQFGSYAEAECRIFMSATVTDDSFWVKGLGLEASVIASSLAYEDEKWTGEKMILIPSLIDPRLERSLIVKMFGEPKEKRTIGVVALCPGDERTKDWAQYGAVVCESKDIYDQIANLRDEGGDRTKAVVLSNRSDGIDLPDGACRILIMDSKPFAERRRHRRARFAITASAFARTAEGKVSSAIALGSAFAMRARSGSIPLRRCTTSRAIRTRRHAPGSASSIASNRKSTNAPEDNARSAVPGSKPQHTNISSSMRPSRTARAADRWRTRRGGRSARRAPEPLSRRARRADRDLACRRVSVARARRCSRAGWGRAHGHRYSPCGPSRALVPARSPPRHRPYRDVEYCCVPRAPVAGRHASVRESVDAR